MFKRLSMTKFPLALKITFTKKIPADVSAQMIEEATEKADEMYFLGKMDLYINFVDDYTTERYFSDNDALEEWLSFIKDATSRNSLGISEIKISEV